MTSDERVVSYERVIAAPPDHLFALIADPSAQPRWDGNDNLAVAAGGQRVRAVGDVFVMTLTRGDDRENHVVEFAEGRRIAWRPSESGQPPPGHLWRWELEPLDDGRTLVRHTYDWSELTDPKRLERARATTADRLRASVDRLADLAAPGTDPRLTSPVAHEDRRAELADAAVRVLAREGGGGLTHHAVDEEACVPAGTTANRFPSRPALVGAVAERIAARHAPETAVLEGLAALLPTTPPITRPRAVAYVVRDGAVLVFTHRPTGSTEGAGLQVPGGTIHDGEDPAAAVVREVREETGLEVEVVRPLGTITRGGRELHHFHVAPLGDVPQAWDHDEMSDGDVPLWTFSLFWLPLPVARRAIDHGMGDLLDRL